MSSYDVFLSHNSVDKEVVREVARWLELAKITTFIDERDLTPGETWQDKLVEALGQSKTCAVFFGPEGAGDWNREEVRIALGRAAKDQDYLVIPVILPGGSQSDIPPLLEQRTWVDLSGGIEPESMKRLCDAIQGKKSAPLPQTRSTKRTGLYGAPRMPTKSFVGREEEIQQLRDVLEQSKDVRIAASVEGLPGVGKTELALQLVYRLGKEPAFPGGIFWFDAEDPDLTSAWGSTIADGFAIPEAPVEQRAKQVLNTLSAGAEPALIVLDNVETWTISEQPGPLPEGDHLRYLVTTRQSHLGGTRFSHVAVGFLKPPFDRELLERVAGRDLDGVEELLEHLKGHALAVELAGAFLAVYPQETPASYLEELRSGGGEEEAVDQVRYGLTVSQAFETLWERLDEDVRSAWVLAACFEPEPVTDELSESVGLTRAMRRKLQRLHLIEVDQDRRWWMHRLTRRFGKTAEGADEARLAFVEGCASFAGRIEISDGFRHYVPNRSHLDAAVEVAPEVLGEEDQRVSSFLVSVAGGKYSIGDYSRTRKLLELALESDLKNLGEDHPGVATRRNNLGLVLKAQGDLDGARKLHEQALASDLKSLGEDHPSVALRRDNLGQVLRVQGDLDGARKLHEQALASDLKNLGEDHPYVAIRRDNLGLVLKAQGDLDGARKLHEQALASGLKNLGEDHPYVASYRNNLGLVLKAQGDLDGARKLHEQALASDLKNLGEDHPKVAIRRSNLGSTRRALGDLSGARELYEQALVSGLKSLGEDHPKVALRRDNLESLLCQIAAQSEDED